MEGLLIYILVHKYLSRPFALWNGMDRRLFHVKGVVVKFLNIARGRSIVTMIDKKSTRWMKSCVLSSSARGGAVVPTQRPIEVVEKLHGNIRALHSELGRYQYPSFDLEREERDEVTPFRRRGIWDR